jgi:hypothetical protein
MDYETYFRTERKLWQKCNQTRDEHDRLLFRHNDSRILMGLAVLVGAASVVMLTILALSGWPDTILFFTMFATLASAVVLFCSALWAGHPAHRQYWVDDIGWMDGMDLSKLALEDAQAEVVLFYNVNTIDDMNGVFSGGDQNVQGRAEGDELDRPAGDDRQAAS